MKNPTSLFKTRILPAMLRRAMQAGLFLFTLLCAAMLSVQTAHAATLTVMNTNDSGAGSLRQALAVANDGDTIDFASAVIGTILLTSGELAVNESVTISGPGAGMLAVDGNFAGRVFYIGPGKTVAIAGITIQHGSNPPIGPQISGGGIYNDHSTLTVSNCNVSGNSAAEAGGIENNGGDSGSATLTIENSTVSGNSSGNGGGGIENNGIRGGQATLTIENSTISGNSTRSAAGGIFNIAVENGIASLIIRNSTFSGNTSSSIPGDIRNDTATVQIGSTILKAGSSASIANVNGGTVTSLGYNLSSDNGGGFLTATGDQINIDPLLGPLQDNGGPTFTHELLTGSPAIDQGFNFSGSTTDQRGPGFARTFDNPSIANATGGDGTDIGAFEVQTIPPCPQPQGDWKNNPNAWPAQSLMLGSQTYTKAQLLTILSTPIGAGGKADASLILADQLIAAKLNIANGADGTPVSSTIADADAVLSLYTGMLPYAVRPNTTNGHRMVNDASVLANYNNGLLPTGCGG